MSLKKEPQRWKRNCAKCGKLFSTHSTNRADCYSCKPKCNEIHTFNHLKKIKKNVSSSVTLALLDENKKNSEKTTLSTTPTLKG